MKQKLAITVLIAVVFAAALPVAEGRYAAWAPASFALPLGADEFGRNAALVLLASAGRSLLLGFVLAAATLGISTLLAYLIVFGTSRRGAVLVGVVADIVEAVPTVLWVLATVAALKPSSSLIAGVALVLATVSFLTVIIRGELERLMGQGYVEASRLLGLSNPEIVLRHLFPNSLPVIGPIFMQIVGTAIAVYGAIGVLGFSRRTDLDLGMILVRGKENVVTHPMLLISGILTILALYLFLIVAQRALFSDVRAPST